MTPRDAIALLEGADPVDPVHLADQSETALAHGRVRRMIADAVETETTWRSPVPARSSRRPIRVAVLIAAGVAILSLIVAALPGHGRPSGLGPLNAAAAVAATQSSTIAPPGRYFHVLEQYNGFAPLGHKSNVRDSYEWWVAANGSGRLVFRIAPWNPGPAPRGCGCHLSGNTLVTDRSFGRGRFAGAYRHYAELGNPHPINPTSLPTDPTALKEKLERMLGAAARNDAAKHAPAGDLVLPQIASLLADPMDSPALRSALFRVAAQLPGVTLQSHVADPAGRTGQAMTVALVSTVPQPTPKAGWPKFRAIFDPKTSQILAWEVIFTDRGTTWVESRTFLEPGIVSSTHSVP
jgi:hypothetical protein